MKRSNAITTAPHAARATRVGAGLLLLLATGCSGDMTNDVFITPNDVATATPTSTTPADDGAAADKLGTPHAASSAASSATRPVDTAPQPAPWDASVFVGKGSAAAVPDAFLPYPRTLTKDAVIALGGEPLDDGEETPTYFTVRPAGAMYERARVWYGSSDKPKRVNIVRFPSADPRAALLELRDALEKRYGKGRARPDGASDEDADRFVWTSPRMNLGFDVPEQIMLEMIYQP